MDQPQTFRSTTALVVWVVWLLFAVGNWIDLAVQGRDHASVVAAAILLLATGVAYVTTLRPRVIVGDAGVTIKNPLRDHRISWAAVTDVDLMDLLRVHCILGDRRKVISAWAVHYSRRRQYSADVKARRAAARTAGGGRPSMFGGGGFPAATRGTSYGPSASPDSSAEAEARLIVHLISERATAARAEALWTASSTPAPTAADLATPATPADPATLADPSAASTTTSTTEATTAPSAIPTPQTPAADSTKLLTSTWSSTALAALAIPALILLIVCLL